MIDQIITALKNKRITVENEKKTQQEIYDILLEADYNVKDEYRLSDQDIPDFFIDGIAIEVKIKGNSRKIYKQCERYAMHNAVTQLLLITNKSMGFPPEINGKPCYVLNIGRAWL